MGAHDGSVEAVTRILGYAGQLNDEVKSLDEELPAAGAVLESIHEAEGPVFRALSRVRDIKQAHEDRKRAEDEAAAQVKARAQAEIDAEAARELAVERRKAELAKQK